MAEIRGRYTKKAKKNGLGAGYRAIARYIPVSPSKVRPVARLVNHTPYLDAEALLVTLPNKGAHFLLKTIRSAAANAMVENKNIDESSLYVKELMITESVRHKRIWARGRGRADRQLKRYAHIFVMLDVK